MSGLKSHRELRIHLTRGHFYCFCSAHFKTILKSGLNMGFMGFTKRYRTDSYPCEVPWCGKTKVREVYPTAKRIISFWQPRSKKRGLNEF